MRLRTSLLNLLTLSVVALPLCATISGAETSHPYVYPLCYLAASRTAKFASLVSLGARINASLPPECNGPSAEEFTADPQGSFERAKLIAAESAEAMESAGYESLPNLLTASTNDGCVKILPGGGQAAQGTAALRQTGFKLTLTLEQFDYTVRGAIIQNHIVFYVPSDSNDPGTLAREPLFGDWLGAEVTLQDNRGNCSVSLRTPS